MATIYNRFTGAIVGYTGSVPGMVYDRSGNIVGGMTSSYTTTPVSRVPYGTGRTPTRETVATPPSPFGPTYTTTGGGNVLAGVTQQTLDQMVADAVRKALGDAGAIPTNDKLPVSESDVIAWINRNYGYLSAYINEPEVGKVLRDAARIGITNMNELFGMLSKTKWWQTTEAQVRQNDYIRNTDPATWQAMVRQKAADVLNQAGQLGVELGGDVLNFAETAQRYGWSPAQVTDYLLQRVNDGRTFTKGNLGSFQNQVKQLAAEYMVSISDASAAEYARKLASEEATVEGVEASFKAIAAARYPYMAKELQAGTKPRDFFLPLRDQVASILELNPNEVDPLKPDWLSLMEVKDKQGNTRGATISEAVQAARRDPRFRTTYRFASEKANAAGQMLSAWGVRL